MEPETRAKHSHNGKPRPSSHRPRAAYSTPPTSGVARATPEPRHACQLCGLVDFDVPRVAVSSTTATVEGRLCRNCIARLRADALTIVEELEAA